MRHGARSMDLANWAAIRFFSLPARPDRSAAAVDRDGGGSLRFS